MYYFDAQERPLASSGRVEEFAPYEEKIISSTMTGSNVSEIVSAVVQVSEKAKD